MLVAADWFSGSSRQIPSDGKTDVTAAIQQRLDQAGQRGGEVYLPPGQYLMSGSLHVPPGVTLRGSWNGPHDSDSWRKGTTLLLVGSRGQENGPAAIEMSSNTVVTGLTLYWPEQDYRSIVPYPWAIDQVSTSGADGNHVTVEDLLLVNAFQGIRVGRTDLHDHGDLHLIRDVYGCVLRRGILVDLCTDIGRIENVHFNPNAWTRALQVGEAAPGDAIAAYQTQNLEAFIFARSDWEYVLNTFVWGAHIGYHFVNGAMGACNGQFLGIGADYCRTCIQVDQIQTEGLQITNGEFTAFAGDPNSALVTNPGATGAVQMMNCNFWGITGHVAWLRGDTAVTFSGCHFSNSPPPGTIVSENGRLIVEGCTFDQPGPAIRLGQGVKAATIFGNLQPQGLRLENKIGARAQVGLNQAK